VIGISGGIDSSVVAFLCARALGQDRVQLLLMPEAESSPDTLRWDEWLLMRSVLELQRKTSAES